MEPTYAVYWSEADGPRYVGRIGVAGTFVELAGTTAGGGRSLARILFGELSGSRYERGRLCLERYSGAGLEIGSLDRPGALREFAQRLRTAIEPDSPAARDAGVAAGRMTTRGILIGVDGSATQAA